MIQGLLAICLLAAAFVTSAQTLEAVPRISVQQIRVADRVVLAGVPDVEKLSELPAATTVVVDLRTAAEGIAEEARLLEQLGYEYHHIPVSGATIDTEQIAALGAIVEDAADKTLIVHCRSANRAAMLWGAHLLEQGDTLEQTLLTVGPGLTSRAGKAALLAFYEARESTHQVSVPQATDNNQ